MREYEHMRSETSAKVRKRTQQCRSRLAPLTRKQTVAIPPVADFTSRHPALDFDD